MLKRDQLSRESQIGGELSDPAFQKDHPYVWAHLTQTKWEDGSTRKLSSIGIYPEGSMLKVLVRDQDSGLICWIATDKLTDFWEVVESALGDPGHEWRVDRQMRDQVASRRPAPPSPNGQVDKAKKKR